jgi:NitT/TauT family transport system substrate-binding protein
MMKSKFLFGLVLFSLLFTACTPAATQAPVNLKIAVLPILDALPMYVAQQKGYFTAHNVTVEFIPVGSAAERDQLIAAGQADGMINDMVATLFYNKETIQVQVVRFARVATPQVPQFCLLASAQSGFTTAADLKGVPIGISEGSVIAYVTDRLLAAEGLAPADIQTVAVPKMPERLALLESGQLQAATLPDPQSLLAIQGGAVIIIDDTQHTEYGNSLYAFRKAVIDAQPQAIRAFLAAIEQAVADINANPKQWDTLLTEHKLVPAPLVGSYTIPTFPTASLPTEDQWNDVLAWAKDKGLITVDISYQNSVNGAFLP